MKSFKEVSIPQALFHRLEQIGFIKPTPIQEKSIPLALQGKDILGSAQTGTGKTAAFGIPLISKLIEDPKAKALILLPTRELALQVSKALAQFIGKSKIKSSLLIGGQDMAKQLRQLKANPALVIGTPGRVNDHLRRKSLKIDKTGFLVLDEVDRMLDMGFGVQLDEIAKYLTSENRQTLMFSATLPKNIEKLSEKYLNDPVRVSVGSISSPAENVKQENIKLTSGEKYVELINQLKARTGSVIIFVKTKRSADNIADKLCKKGFKADALHGDLRQSRRNKVIENYRKQEFNILVATDVAARGLDIPHIEHVINYDLPQSPEDYIHRIGRTARAGAQGEALNFISPEDGAKWRNIERLLNPNKAQDGNEGLASDGQADGKRKSRRRSRSKSKGRFGSTGPVRQGNATKQDFAQTKTSAESQDGAKPKSQGKFKKNSDSRGVLEFKKKNSGKPKRSQGQGFGKGKGKGNKSSSGGGRPKSGGWKKGGRKKVA